MRAHVFSTLLLLTALPLGAEEVKELSLEDAESIAIQSHPQIQAARDLAVAASERVRQVRSAYFPTLVGSLTGVVAESNTRIAAGGLNNPVIYDRYANGVSIGQLVTDFGRTHKLSKSASLHAKAQEENVVAAREDVLLMVDEAYFAVLRAQAVLKVAEDTVHARELVADQVSALAQNQIKSGLDKSFAKVDLAQAQLLLVQAQNGLEASYAQLSAALGSEDQKEYRLKEVPLPPSPPTDFSDLLKEALKNRPQLVSQRLDADSARDFALAERDLWFPSINVVGSAGLTPYRASQLASRYAAAGFNVSVPLFNGHLFGALKSEAEARARAQEESVRGLQDEVVRQVRTAWLNAKSAFERLALTDQLLKNATDALDLAQSRYKLGLSSIIELSQAQLNLTQAELSSASSKYDYATQVKVLDYEVGSLGH